MQRRLVRLIPRFPITQSTGKVRPIDDADKGGQSELSADANHLEFCSALRPAQHVWALQQAAVLRGGTVAGIPDQLHSAEEDWPDAYRLVPMIPQHAEACVVVFWHPEWNSPAFQLYSGMLFGLPIAVTSFNRYSRLCEALIRRILGVLFLHVLR